MKFWKLTISIVGYPADSEEGSVFYTDNKEVAAQWTKIPYSVLTECKFTTMLPGTSVIVYHTCIDWLGVVQKEEDYSFRATKQHLDESEQRFASTKDRDYYRLDPMCAHQPSHFHGRSLKSPEEALERAWKNWREWRGDGG